MLKAMRYRVNFDRSAPDAIVPVTIQKAEDDPVGITTAGDRLAVTVEAEDEPDAGREAVRVCALAGLHYPAR